MEKLCRRHVSWWKERAADRAIVEYAPRQSMMIRIGIIAEVKGRNVRMDDGFHNWHWIPDLDARIKPT